ncbi:hypothetical protein TNCT_307371 [Trichonephila clavata]|uniref:Uncharacterized protein n=1 Tax=Trichonephila clavata TaxID=2740835 RepID=A0A8X6FYE1_TRICU|nr:hypothetical protein TNCT_307371 [Trichonephila clavata]
MESIPKELVRNMTALVSPIFRRIRTIKTFYNFTPEFNTVNLDYPVPYWTPYGTVDTKQHGELLVQDERIDIALKYSLACHDCFEEILPKFFNLISDV